MPPLASPPDAVVFDLDGTLIDSRRDITTAVNRTREGTTIGSSPASPAATPPKPSASAKIPIQNSRPSPTSPPKKSETVRSAAEATRARRPARERIDPPR